MIVYADSLKRVRDAFEHYRNEREELPDEVKVRQDHKSPAKLRVTITYPNRTEELILQ